MRRRRLWRGASPVEFEDQFQDVAAVLYTRRVESDDHLYRALWTGLGFRARDFWKSARRREIPYGDMFGEDSPVPSVDGVEDHGRVVADARHVGDCLSDLDERERAVYRLTRGESLSRRNAAKALGIKEADVLRALYSAQQKVDRFVLLFVSRRLCARRGPVVQALARSDAEPQEVQQARAHLAHCSDCLVAFREYRAALSERIASVLPLPALASTSSLSHLDDRLLATVRELGAAAKRHLYTAAGRGPSTGTTAEAAAGAGAGPTWFRLLRVLDGIIPNATHRPIASLAEKGVLRAVVTTNFDTLFERAVPRPVTRLNALLDEPAADAGTALIKLHGSANLPASLVDLAAQKRRGVRRQWRAWLENVFATHAVLVLGFSGADLELGDDYLGVRAASDRTPWLRWNVRASAAPHPKAAEARRRIRRARWLHRR